MADYAYTGKKGTGKSKHVVMVLRDRYLRRGRRVATNLDLYLEPMFGPYSRKTYVRLPDKPTAFDLEAAGHGNPDDPYDEDRAGAMVIDEAGSIFNSRTFGDKSRGAVLDWLALARKRGYDCFYIMQDVIQIDRQIRDAFIEFTFRHRRTDRVKWMFVGGLLGVLFGERAAYMPRMHFAVGRMGTNPQDLVSDRVWGTWRDVEPCYDTHQMFREDYPHGAHSVLSPWHVKGRYLRQERPPFWSALLRAAIAGFPAPARPRPLPVTAPDPAWARVRALAAQLPPEQALPLLSRYARSRHAA